MNCDWCKHDVDLNIDGIIALHEKAPFDDSMDDEIYHFCSYKCLKRWLGL